MDKIFKNIGIVGLGLIGGSLARTIKKRNLADTIVGFGRNQERMQKACGLGLIDEFYVGYEQGFKDIDLVVLGTPVKTIIHIAREVIPHLSPGTVITDVGSVKAQIVEQIEAIMPPGLHFIGGHPIAGTENSGFEWSLTDLFEDRKCILTPTDNSNQRALDRLKQFWIQAGSRVICMDVKTHDMILAAISHLPHMVAFSLVNAIVDMEDSKNNILQYSAGGFKDFTRIAASDPVMWRDIALLNKENLIRSIDFFEKALASLKDAIQREDGKNIEELFWKSHDTRRGI